jgi:tetraacyldisaccharide 4'-kinase
VPESRSRIERIWFGPTAADSAFRMALFPAESLYRIGVRVRSELYDRGVLRIRTPPVPALSVGNLSIGGTGKTPVAAWLAGRLRAAGARPAIVMRGYGEDEPLVHARLNPDVPVVTAPDRLDGARRAVAGGADCIVLDDAFQHRKIGRTEDVVLVSADRWDGRAHLLPAGPWREPLRALRRSTLVLVTRKGVPLSIARSVAQLVAAHTQSPVALAELALDGLRTDASSAPAHLAELEGERVLAIAAVGDPLPFRRQLEAFGANVRTAFFPDHHRFTRANARLLASMVTPGERAICTLKDYVKLAPLWPRAASSLWYVSQRVVPEFGEAAIDHALDSVLRARKT